MRPLSQYHHRNKGSEMAMQAARRLPSLSLQRRLLLPSQAEAPSIPTAATAIAFVHSHATSFGYKQVREEDKSKLVGNAYFHAEPLSGDEASRCGWWNR
ncbi:2-methoxy-6-polyprenyl-1,4-benzoquinol methylase, mitochondrial [Zea mays]|uniref:2-methoxy-6-polyprenyl-1,4-benzoquinol methylase, mitochondrial n=1 Tax=Zea mays TaxID=4577 RepID=A0A3L6EVX3_MAIZE|nr:2-methoxy-6-polyprenyl-1,4-benzoquinol methylase, mitochondrial [Zea mays]